MKHKNLIRKRFKISKNKKVLHRVCGQNHFNAKESSKVTRNKRRAKQMSKSFRRTILRNA